MVKTNTRIGKIAAVLVCMPLLVWAFSSGPDAKSTAAPGDNSPLSCAAAGCHTGTALNGGGGNVALTFPNGLTYTPGQTQRVRVTITDSTAKVYGFQATSRLQSNLSRGQAGTFTKLNNNYDLLCENGAVRSGASCPPTAPLEYIEHNTPNRANFFEFDWTPPATDVGRIMFYVSGNAANGNGADTGDHIYTTTALLIPSVSTGPKPTISGVANGASFAAGIMQNSWITITGTNLATTTRSWTSAELAGGRLPTALDGTSVTVNGKAAFVNFISPTQINAFSPADPSEGPVSVTVTVNGQTSVAAATQLNASMPAFFSFDGTYLAATHADNSFLGKVGLFPSAPTLTTPAKPGETIILYGTGFGATEPTIPSGQLTDMLGRITGQLVLTIGGTQANVAFAGLIPPFAGLYQFNVVVPDTLSNGDQPVIARIGGATSLSNSKCCSITVQR